MDNPSQPTPPPRSRLRRIVLWTGGGLLALTVLLALGVWVAGRVLPSALGVALSDRTGATLTCADNRTNLFLGRVELADLVVANGDSGELLKVKRLLVDLDTPSFLADGTRVVEEVELDLDHVRLVGGADPLRDNNLTALVRAWQASAGPSDPAPTVAAEPSGESKFLIRRLRLRVGGFSLSQALPGMPERVISRDDRGLEFLATDVTNENLTQTVMAPLAAAAITRAAASPENLLDSALRRQRK